MLNTYVIILDHKLSNRNVPFLETFVPVTTEIDQKILHYHC